MITSPFRIAVGLFGLILGTASVWLLPAELARPGVTALPLIREAAAGAATWRGDALWAARFGGVRGDLWAEAGFTYADLEWADLAHVDPPVLDEARTILTQAVSLKPTNSAVWLLMANLALRFSWQTPSPFEAVKMSYYTGPHEDALTPLRLLVATRLNVAADPELERLFQQDIQTILSNRPNLKPALLSAYAGATPQARQAMETTAASFDPDFAKALHPDLRR